MTSRKPALLILGGTGEALSLARAAEAKLGDRLRVIYSLAGRTRNPAKVGGEVRVGGFGGVEGLAGYLRDTGIGFLIDATHPFSAQISHHACLAAAAPRRRGACSRARHGAYRRVIAGMRRRTWPPPRRWFPASGDGCF